MEIYFQAIRYRASGRGALGYCKFANVFSAKIYFQAIREKFCDDVIRKVHYFKEDREEGGRGGEGREGEEGKRSDEERRQKHRKLRMKGG